MTRLVLWIVGILVAILALLFGSFGAMAAFRHQTEQQAGFSIHF